jgi:hypothetical protein
LVSVHGLKPFENKLFGGLHKARHSAFCIPRSQETLVCSHFDP